MVIERVGVFASADPISGQRACVRGRAAYAKGHTNKIRERPLHKSVHARMRLCLCARARVRGHMFFQFPVLPG